MAVRHILKAVHLKLASRIEIGTDVYAFRFVALKPLKWRAGQHGVLEIKLPSGKTGRKSFSIASAPGEGIITIATRIQKDRIDEFKQSLFRLKKGDSAKLRGPFGPMHIKDTAKQYAFLATAIGITPFRAILKQLELDKAVDTKVTLFYVGNAENHFFKEELNQLKATLKNLSIDYIHKPERITGQIITDRLGKDLDKTTFYIAGSLDMVKSYKRTLQGLGVANRNIKSNPFLSFKARLPKRRTPSEQQF
jgi:ferredoxin-NADP reductase